ncbi:protein SABRE-like [Vigna unguiculata]|uniref:protein SABRE-like n=1 Tax=Vigna unguiculata TaxID=3917 RepID=UPI001015E389|nr:protein SABRE-like [Vigna unguiculata]
MEISPINFLHGFTVFCVTLVVLFISSFALLSWILSRVLGASVGFCVGGFNSVKDVELKFKKGAVESLSVGEIKLSFRRYLVDHSTGFRSWDPKLQLIICNIEVVTRPPIKSTEVKKKKPKKSSSGSSGKGKGKGKGKWKTISNIAKYLSLCVTNVVLKTPKFTLEIGKLNVDISKAAGTESDLLVRVQILPIVFNLIQPQISNELSESSGGGSNTSTQTTVASTEKTSATFVCEKFSVSCTFGQDREMSIAVKSVDISIGDIIVNSNEGLLEKKKSSSESSSDSKKNIESSVDDPKSKKPPSSKQEKVSGYISKFPQTVNFNLSKVNVSFTHRERNLFVENSIVGLQFKSIKSRPSKDGGESRRLHFQLEFGEINLFKEVGSSILEISSVKLASFVYVPVVQSVMLIRAETEVKIGRSQCNIVMSRIKPWLLLKPPSKQKKLVIREEPAVVKPKSKDESLTIVWTCNLSTSEFIIMLFNMAGSPLYNVCLKSAHVSANNTSKMGIAVHSELGELSLKMANENQECLEESIFGAESNSASILHIAKICVDWGKKDMKSSEKDAPKCVLCLSVVVTSLGIYLSFERIESFISTAISFQVLFKSLAGPKKKSTNTRSHSSKNSGKGTQMIKFNLEQCSVYILGETGIENAVVPDPKRVNYGSQGGRVIISVSADGTPRTANVISTVSDEYQKLKYCICLQIIDLKLSVNKEKRSKQVELKKARCLYQEYYNETRPVSKVPLFEIRYIKFVQRLGGIKENAACSLFSATEISLKWEPDLHLSLIELVLQLKLALHNSKLRERSNEKVEDVVSDVKDSNVKNETPPLPSGHAEKKKDSVFAVDVEMLKISAVLGDGVDAMVQVRSIFSENARIGVLLEGLLFYFNGARLVKSSRMQLSRIPSKSAAAISDAKGVTVWDWVIQGLDVHICLPFRLELRAIDDALEDMLRALKLIVAAKTNMIFPVKKDSSKAKKPSSVKFGCLKFFLRKLTFDIEEEPLQGWLDEHYPLLKKEVGDLAVRLNFLDDFISKAKKDPNSTDDTCLEEKKIYINDIEVDLNDPSVVESMREDIYRRTFQSYYESCQNKKFYDGSGAYKNDELQSGFKLSTARSFVLSVFATELEVTLTKIDGGEDGMIEILRTLDPVCRELEIPFSRLYGANIVLNTGSLVAQIRDYTYPLFGGTSGKCEGRVVMAQQATSFQPQMVQDVYVGEWRKVSMLRSATGTTPPMKTYTDLTLRFQKGEVSYGVGYEPVFADISYAFTVVLRRANLSLKTPGPLIVPPKKEKSLPWWDDMRNYIHGNITLIFSETYWNLLGTSDPYEKYDKLVLLTGYMEIQQSDGRIFLSSEDFNIHLTSLESLATKHGAKIPPGVSGAFFEVPVFILEVLMDWGCDSERPLNHYLFSLPIEGKPREFVFDPFRSTALSIKFSVSFRSLPPPSEKQSSSSSVAKDSTEGDANVHQPPRTSQNTSPTINLGSHDLSWLTKFGTLMALPPHKLRLFSRFPRYGCARIIRSGNLPLDRVITEFMMRIDGTPIRIKNVHLHDDDPAKGLTFSMTKLKVEVCFGRGKQKFTFECFRPGLDVVYLGVDLHMPKVFLSKEDCSSISKLISITPKGPQTPSKDKTPSKKGCMTQKNPDDGFFLSGDYFTIRKQSPKADPDSLIAWHEAGKIPSDNTYVRPQRGNRNETDDQAQSDASDDEGYNVVIADSCQRVFVYGLKLLWNIENRNAICFWVASLSKAAAPTKPSPSRQYVQRKLREEKKKQEVAETNQDGAGETAQDDGAEVHPDDGAEAHNDEGTGTNQDEDSVPLNTNNISDSPSAQTAKNPELPSSPPKVDNVDNVPSSTKKENGDEPEEGTRHFMVNIVEPQFNLHSEDANGRFLLAAASGRILAQSYHSVLQVGLEMIEQEANKTEAQSSEYQPEIAWKRWELSVMLEHVQAHVAPTDVDLGAGVQWLPKIQRGSPKVMRTGALLERVFMPCDMYFQFTRHKGGTPELKVKPLKELTFNSHNITAKMTSRQFQVMLDVLCNLLLARVPKPRKSSMTLFADDDEDKEEEADEIVPDGVEEVELEKINLERKERDQNLIRDDIRKLCLWHDVSRNSHPEEEASLWMIDGGIGKLVQELEKELVNAKKFRKEAYASLRVAMHKAAQQRLMEKEKNKSPSYAMRISMQINKVVWSMILDGKPFAEVEINDMIYDFDRDYRDIGISLFTTKFVVFRNCLSNAKSDTILSAWNPPPDWGKKVMVKLDARQGAPKDGNSPFELFYVEIYPLKIHLTEAMYRMMWVYFFPEEKKDSQRRQEVWKVSTTAGARRMRKGSADGSSAGTDAPPARTGFSAMLFPTVNPLASQADSAQASKAQNAKANPAAGQSPELKRTSSDKTKEDAVAESAADGGKEIAGAPEEKKARPQKIMEFHNIKISQVELCVTYEGSRFVVSDMKLLMDQFHRVEFTGTWKRLISRVKKHIIWGVLKSVTGMQIKKFKDKGQIQLPSSSGPELDSPSVDSEGKSDKLPPSFPKRPTDGAGDGFVTSIKGIFSHQRRKAKAFVQKTTKNEGQNEVQGELNENDPETSPFARQLTITQAKKLIRKHTKKLAAKGQKGTPLQQIVEEALPISPKEDAIAFDSDSSSDSSSDDSLPDQIM